MKTTIHKISATVVTVGILALCVSAKAQDQNATLLTKEVHFEKVPQIGGGDADVNSQNGRPTIVRVWTDNLVNHGSYLTLEVHYSIEEGHKNNTLLEKDALVKIEAPVGYSIEAGSEGVGRRNTDFSKTYTSQNHLLNDISNEENVTGTYFTLLQIKFDDVGDDDKGNAQLKGVLSVPVKLKKAE